MINKILKIFKNKYSVFSFISVIRRILGYIDIVYAIISQVFAIMIHQLKLILALKSKTKEKKLIFATARILVEGRRYFWIL